MYDQFYNWKKFSPGNADSNDEFSIDIRSFHGGPRNPRVVWRLLTFLGWLSYLLCQVWCYLLCYLTMCTFGTILYFQVHLRGRPCFNDCTSELFSSQTNRLVPRDGELIHVIYNFWSWSGYRPCVCTSVTSSATSLKWNAVARSIGGHDDISINIRSFHGDPTNPRVIWRSWPSLDVWAI